MFRQLISPVRAVFQNCGVERNSHKLVGPCGESVVSVLRSFAPWSTYHTSSVLHIGRQMKANHDIRFKARVPRAEGEDASFTELRQPRVDERFPDMRFQTKEFNGIMFKDLPILNVKATMNNTLFNIADPNGAVQTMRSCGYDGFKNSRKGTNVAAQATGFMFGKKLMQRGFRTVRARVSGLGAGRLSSLKGITLAGVNIVSITDSTPVSWDAPRARKRRRI